MAPARRPGHRIGASRRRREEDGEDEGSVAGEIEQDDDSMSEGSLPSHLGDDDDDDADADGEGSNPSEHGESDLEKRNGHVHRHGREHRRTGGRGGKQNAESHEDKLGVPIKPTLTSTVSDTEAMMNGLKMSDSVGEVTQEIQFDQLHKSEEKVRRIPSAPPTESRRETFAERKRREDEEYHRAREEDPAFVPTRGGFFLHDKRSTDGANGHRSHSNRPKSRPYGLIVDGNVGRRQKPEASDGRWTHDLHETVARDDRAPSQTFAPPSHSQYNNNNNNNAGFSNGSAAVSLAPRSSPPNRSFSTTLLIGNVPVRVFLPGMETVVPFPSVPKRQHTCLPQHRPPLRRDKPVRISLPGAEPRYVLPAPERSFIFIPRAMRPNQQSYRGRGRGGGYYTGRRPSLYPGSAYSPSLPMSRRSSLREGMHSPAGSVLSRHTIVTGDKKPVVRLPPPIVRPPGPPHQPMPGAVVGNIPTALPILPMPAPHTAWRESRSGPIPMHQPRPQKTVSVADIESPASFGFNPPQPQHEQPFHQQVPGVAPGPGYGPENAFLHGRHPSHPSQPSGTPLSHIPERAIHAAPFQPYGPPAQPPYFTATGYPPAAVYYPTEYPHYTPPAATLVPPPPPPPGAGTTGQPYVVHQAPPPPIAPQPTAGEHQGQPHTTGTVAHEANGTVYFYDAQELYHPNAPYHTTGGVVGMGGMMTPPGATYYYPQSSGPVYYTQQ